ncbi:40S ribosomal S8 [Cryptosporidium sp. chipmunk genotype I]|uniref:40S ribosomal S8 n=1 Tax=Cryptosporidium sp. chipmunk genotype I TaxID=1280935 RepID=UPI003519D889|nr:40S ribosomal S8 [Cryptosporidium sp. chipmunk genotype I]
MGISRDSRHKHRATGGRMPIVIKKRKYEMGRPASNTKLGTSPRVRVVRCRGGNKKFRALRLDSGNYSWGSQGISRKARIMEVVYNASNNELVRTKTLVKNAIVVIDATPFRQFYLQRYGVELGRRKNTEETGNEKDTQKASGHLLATRKARLMNNVIDPLVEEQFGIGRLLACVSSRPGQCGRCDGYILEGKELEFYKKKLEKKKAAK